MHGLKVQQLSIIASMTGATVQVKLGVLRVSIWLVSCCLEGVALQVASAGMAVIMALLQWVLWTLAKCLRAVLLYCAPTSEPRCGGLQQSASGVCAKIMPL